MGNEIIIKPLRSVYKVCNMLRIFSFLFLILVVCGLMTDGYLVLLILQFIIFLSVHIYATFKVIWLRKQVYLLKEGRLITDKDIIFCNSTDYKLDEHGNVIFFIKDRKVKINRLSYNFDALLTLLDDSNSVQEKGTV